MAAETKLRPHDVMRLAATDRLDDLLAGESIWLCLTCETCTSRCPNRCDPARVMDALRELAVARAPRPIGAFHRSFLDQVERSGRMFELGLILQYKLRTGELLKDATAGPGMLSRGKLKLLPHAIDGVADVRRIFAACRAAGEEGEA
jgi:heterodisulfide reductase subunit C